MAREGMSVTPGELYELTGVEAVTRMQRRRGLAHLDIHDAPSEMYFPRCRSIHTFGMRFPIDVIFLDRHNCVLGSKIVRPRRIVCAPHGTYTIVERPR